MTTPGSVHRDLCMRICAIAFSTALLSGWLAAPARADAITDDNVVEAVSAAKTPADHQALAAYFTAKAEAATEQAEKHAMMATAFTGKARKNMQMHCNALVRSFKDQAKDYAALAKEQKQLAGSK